jgi:multiple sugar transport system ATP-binding protein
MGRALVREPSVFLMDEPLSNLDAQLRVQMRSEVLRVQRRLGVATLYVTHDQTEAMTMGDRVAVLRDGVLQQFAQPQELYDRPANLFVASFMGSPSMNLYEASVARADGASVISLGSDRLRLPDGLAASLAGLSTGNGSRLVVGVRPENLSIADGDARPAEGNCLHASVELVEALGNEQLVHFSIDAPKVGDDAAVLAPDNPQPGPGAEDIAAAVLAEGVARADPRLPVKVGEQIELVVDVDRLHLFDAATGAALTSSRA